MTLVDTLEDRAAIQRNFSKLEEWANKNFMKFSKSKSQVLHLGKKNCQKQYRLGTYRLGSRSTEKDLGVLMDMWGQAAWEPAVCLGSKEGQQYPGLYSQ